MKTKITKRKALSLFKKGSKIYLKPSKLSEQVMDYSPWFNWYDVSIKYLSDIESQDIEKYFKSIINEYIYYNCNCEVGNIVNFYHYESI
jgi:hypothetical protein